VHSINGRFGFGTSIHTIICGWLVDVRRSFQYGHAQTNKVWVRESGRRASTDPTWIWYRMR
jgi:hypothetical protein